MRRLVCALEGNERMGNESDCHAKSASCDDGNCNWPVQMKNKYARKVCKGQHASIDQRKASQLARAYRLVKYKSRIEEIRKQRCDDTAKQVRSRHCEPGKFERAPCNHEVRGCITEPGNAESAESPESNVEIHLFSTDSISQLDSEQICAARFGSHQPRLVHITSAVDANGVQVTITRHLERPNPRDIVNPRLLLRRG